MRPWVGSAVDRDPRYLGPPIKTIMLTLGAGSQLLLERPFKSVLIGNLNVVDVQNLTGSSVILRPLKIGGL